VHRYFATVRHKITLFAQKLTGNTKKGQILDIILLNVLCSDAGKVTT